VSEQSDALDELDRQLTSFAANVDVELKRTRIGELEGRMGAPGFWDDQATAQQIVQELKAMKNIVEPWTELRESVDACRDLRAARSNVPIFLLTALKEDVDRIIGLEIGADDYLGKPFNPRELIARVRAVLRRRGEVPAEAPLEKTYHFEGYSADPQTRRVTGPHGDVDLTGAEFDLLKTFLERPGRVLARDQLLDRVWGSGFDGDTRTVDLHVRRLRLKVEDDPGDPRLIETVWGVGYRMKESV